MSISIRNSLSVCPEQAYLYAQLLKYGLTIEQLKPIVLARINGYTGNVYITDGLCVYYVSSWYLYDHIIYSMPWWRRVVRKVFNGSK